MNPRVYADFQNLDDRNRIRLNTVGTREDLDRAGLALRKGMPIRLYTDDADDQGNPDDLIAEGTVDFNCEEQCWVAVVDWSRLMHAFEERTADTR